MKSKLISEKNEKTYAVIFEAGDEVGACLVEFARENRLGSSHFTAIGALESATLGYFDWKKKVYEKIPINEQVEVISMVGDVALEAGEQRVHAHLVISKRDGSAYGGHLLEAYVRPTLELILTESPIHLHRKHDKTSGLALIELG